MSKLSCHVMLRNTDLSNNLVISRLHFLDLYMYIQIVSDKLVILKILKDAMKHS